MAVKKKSVSIRIVMKKPSKRLSKIAAELARTKIELAKRETGRMSMPVINFRPKVETQAFFVRARMVETQEMGYGPTTFLARVPVTLTTIPELPEVVRLEDKFFVLTNTVPVTYSQKQYAEATRL